MSSRCFRHPHRTCRRPSSTGWSAWTAKAGFFCRSSLSTKSKRGLPCSTTTAKAAGLKAWLAGLIAGYNDKILGLDAATAAVSGRLEASAAAGGHAPGMADAIIAGIAHVHDLTVVTRNIRHLLPFGIDVSSPDAVAGSE